MKQMKAKRGVLECGDTILNGRYTVLDVLHTSGMSNVYRVSDSNLGKIWCLKEIKKSEAGRDQIEYKSLIQEANIMKSLNHSSIPRITTIEQDGDSIFIIMDYVDGINMKTFLSRKGRVDQEVAVSWMKQICQVMIYLHNRKQPIFYRDMKPDNIIIQQDGNIKLIDFGISIVIKEKGQKIGRALGTKGYAAPEQSKSDNVCDLRSDIYGMGMTMYYMLTGLNPNQIPKDKLKPVRSMDSSISIGLENILNKCIQKDPNDRYQDCEELLYDLQNYQKLDSNYRNRLRRKVNIVFSMFLLSIFILITSFIPLNMYNAQEKAKYETLLNTAQQTGREDDYIAVLEANSTKIEPYEGYIESIKVDGVFTKDEETKLLNYMNPNLDKLRSSSDYGKLAYAMGKLYWFYYEGSSEDDGILTSIKWFNDAIEENYEPELSKVYYNLGTFKRDISSSITESEDGGMYGKYFNNLIEAKKSDNGELVNLQLNLALAKCISTYAYNLKTDGITLNEITDQVNDIKDFVKNYEPTLDRVKESYDSLIEITKTLSDKVNDIYKGGEQ